MSKCYRCNTNEADGPQILVHTLLGYTVALYKDDRECKECVQKNFTENFERYGKDLVLVGHEYPGRVRVYWNHYWYISHGTIEGTYLELQAAGMGMARVLIYLGILSFDAKDNWDIQQSPGPVGLNPRFGDTGYLYFTRKHDAMEYARLVYKDAIYMWSIRKYSEVVSKKEVLERGGA